MPRKVRITADAAQNRENQARSRARRKAYVADLEARVRGFEERGVRATLEMQRAARDVAWVNARLMDLLAAKGVARAEVDAFLRRDGGAGGGGASEGAAEPPPPPAATAATTTLRTLISDRDGVVAGLVTYEDGGAEERISPLVVGGWDVAKDAADAGAGDSGRTPCGARSCGGSSASSVVPAPAPKPCNKNTAGDSGVLVTSCDNAATIIADFQGHDDVSRVRTALGCGDKTDCHVKNTMLFQLMDETG